MPTDPRSSPRVVSRRTFVEQGATAMAGLALGPSLATFHRSAGDFSLRTDGIEAHWSTAGGVFRATRVVDRIGNRAIAPAADPFALRLHDGTTVTAGAMRIRGGTRAVRLRGDPRASRLAERLGGHAVELDLEHPATGLRVTWRAVARDGSRYLRQEIVLAPTNAPVPIGEILLLDLGCDGAGVEGSVKGSPVVAGNLFFGFEHPLSAHTVAGSRVTASLARELPLRPGTTFTVSSVIGTSPPGQLRREFLQYLERERAHPYRTFLHYNSWYDLGYFNKYDEAGALDVIRAFGEELHVKRNVTLSSFLFDDGWDDSATLWHFNQGFPNGFTKLREAAARYGAAPGVWLSPWGGYGDPRKQRLQYGAAQGYETNQDGFALSGPRYYQLFHDTCESFIRDFGVNQFKFDGTGNASRVVPGSAFDSDFDAMISLIGDLRRVEPDLYVNLTTGTYPSPFWLRHCDSIWRGGDDDGSAGVGSAREQWITYRDADTHAGIVEKGPLYPLNSLMLHGMIYAKHGGRLAKDPGNDLRNEIRSYFGTGTQLQEMYITPALLTPQNWDDIAEAANWSRANAATLVDTHWVGGDPAKLEAYGWASWSMAKGILVLRNPADTPRTIAIDPAAAFELPEHAPRDFAVASPWRGADDAPIRLSAGTTHEFTLQPFEVLTLEAQPA